MRRVFGNAVVSMATLAVLLLALVSVDGRVRERIADVLTTPPSSAELAGARQQLQQVSTVVLTAARDQSIEHAPLVIFAAAATVLVIFMVRT